MALEEALLDLLVGDSLRLCDGLETRIYRYPF
jgi:hypothetical protein